MIALLASLAMAPVRVVEMHDASADRVTVQALVRMPGLDSLGVAAAQVLAKSLLGTNDRFSRTEMRSLSAPGFEPQAYAMPDHIAIRFSVYPADAATGVRMMAAIVTTARLEPEDLKLQIKRQSELRRQAWERALSPEPRQWNWLKPADVVDLYRATFRPENVTLAVGGPIRPGAAKAAWDEATADWRVGRARRLPPGAEGALESEWSGSRIVELRGPHWMPAQEGATLQLLAAIALGGGKGSAAFQALRVKHSLSYRQEAAVWPTRSGLRTRILVATDADAEAVRQALLDEVAKWDDGAIARAVGYARATFGWGADLSPLYLKPASPLGGSLEDRTLWAAYWEFKTETPWDLDGWLEQASQVGLEDLRAASLALLRDAEPMVHGG